MRQFAWQRYRWEIYLCAIYTALRERERERALSITHMQREDYIWARDKTMHCQRARALKKLIFDATTVFILVFVRRQGLTRARSNIRARFYQLWKIKPLNAINADHRYFRNSFSSRVTSISKHISRRERACGFSTKASIYLRIRFWRLCYTGCALMLCICTTSDAAMRNIEFKAEFQWK